MEDIIAPNSGNVLHAFCHPLLHLLDGFSSFTEFLILTSVIMLVLYAPHGAKWWASRLSLTPRVIHQIDTIISIPKMRKMR